MPNGSKSIWLATHLYYNEPWEEFLTRAVEPYVKTVMRTGIAESYFFVRYWERGPHIRLRFKADPTVVDQLLRPNLLEHFTNYFETKPSSRTEPAYPQDFPEELRWLSNDSIQFMPYEAELNRYGGIAGMEIAERQFRASSDISLLYIKEKGFKWTYDDALGAAIKLHLSFIHTMGLNLAEVASFFQMIFQNWLPRSFSHLEEELSEEMYRSKSEQTFKAFQDAFDLQKGAILSFVQVLWNALEEKSDFDEDILNTWITQNEVVRLQLHAAQDREALHTRELNYTLSKKQKEQLSADQRLRWNIYADFIHMTNNRLGIFNKDEGYLGFLIMESVRYLLTSDPSMLETKDWLNSPIERNILDELF